MSSADENTSSWLAKMGDLLGLQPSPPDTKMPEEPVIDGNAGVPDLDQETTPAETTWEKVEKTVSNTVDVITGSVTDASEQAQAHTEEEKGILDRAKEKVEEWLTEDDDDPPGQSADHEEAQSGDDEEGILERAKEKVKEWLTGDEEGDEEGGTANQQHGTEKATLFVVVRNDDGPVDGASVSVTGTSSVPEQKTVNGMVSFTVDPGDYHVNASKEKAVWQPGFASSDRLQPGQTLTVTLSKMNVASEGEAVLIIHVLREGKEEQPIPGAHVSVVPKEAPDVTTTEQGTAQFVVPHGEYQIIVKAAGQTKSRNTRITGGPEEHWIRFSAAAGLIVNASWKGSKAPVVGASVSLSGGHRATTDGQGNASFLFLEPKNYDINVDYGGANRFERDFYVQDMGGPITRFFYFDEATLTVDAKWNNGDAIQGAEVMLSPEYGIDWKKQTNWAGRAVFQLPAGQYHITVNAEGQSETRYFNVMNETHHNFTLKKGP